MTKIFTLLTLALFAFSAPALAGPKLMHACKKDLKKLGCKVKTDQEAHLCLEKNEKHDAKDDGFSHGCYEANEAFEKAEQKPETKEEGKTEAKPETKSE
jgi:hypothetical protein